MNCECGSPTTTERSAVRRYVIGGLPHVELHGVEVTTCPNCGEEVSIPRITELHRVLADVFVRQQRKLVPEEVRFLRKHIGLSAVDFARLIGVAPETVSRWETGKKPLGPQTDRLLRMIVVRHEPSDCYAVDDFLRSITDEQAPKRVAPVELWNDEKGWTSERHVALAAT